MLQGVSVSRGCVESVSVSQGGVGCCRVSPITVLIAMRVYENGSAALKWTRNNSVVEALNTAFACALKVGNPFVFAVVGVLVGWDPFCLCGYYCHCL